MRDTYIFHLISGKEYTFSLDRPLSEFYVYNNDKKTGRWYIFDEERGFATVIFEQSVASMEIFFDNKGANNDEWTIKKQI